jgi:hypothetical protein
LKGPTDPATVKGPQWAVTKVRVRQDGRNYQDPDPRAGFSVCELDWEGYPMVGVRWDGRGEYLDANGNRRFDPGYPSSRGWPVWCNLPFALGKVLLAEVDRLAALDQAKAEGRTVTVQPISDEKLLTAETLRNIFYDIDRRLGEIDRHLGINTTFNG